MGALTDPIPVFIEFDVGSHFLHLLYKVESLLVDDRIVKIFGSRDHIRIILIPLMTRVSSSDMLRSV